MEKATLKKLYKTALYTSPLLGLYSFAYPFTFSKAFGFKFPMNDPRTEIYNEYLIYILPMVFISTVSFIIWLINIQLLRYQTQKENKISDPLRYLVSFILVAVLISILTTISEELRGFKSAILRIIPIIATTSNNAIILILINLTVNRDKRIQLELEKSQFELSALMARQEQLRHQIHPHMLFNTLSTLKVLIKKDPDLAQNYLVKLSNFLRKSLDTEGQYLSPLNEEVELAKDFLDLQKLRFKDAIIADFKLDRKQLEFGKLPLFSLQILIENAVKHNAQSSYNPLKITIESLEDTISVTNNLIQSFQKNGKEGVGLKNLKERYQLLNTVEPEIIKDENKNTYTVKLKVLS